ncbi:MAG TPA: hypothetical protein VHC69_20010 [Polyangiaceae bacterium]|nr:hypothetical protein [Polyangiaceae bacterium]
MATKDTLDAAASRLVGRYELLVPVVSGALGELWQARIASGPEQGRIVHVRRLPRSVGLEKREVERFTNAGFAAMELRHPRIAAVLDVVVGPTEIAIVSEHIAGAVLQAIVSPKRAKRGSVTPGVASRVILDLLEAIDALREPWAEIFSSSSTEDRLLRTSLHGGLLPDGVLVASFGEAMLLEAGLAGVALTLPAILDQPDVIAYRAPEQLEPGRSIDERADVFTAGILLWEMISGRSLFAPAVLPRPAATSASASPRADPIAVSGARRRVLSHPIPRLDALPLSRGKVPKDLADWVARCLERDPGRRFGGVRDAIRSLSSLGGEAMASHDAVVAFVKSLGLPEPAAPDTEQSPGPSSNRPTVPPVEQADTTRDFGEKAQAQAAQMLAVRDSIPPSTDVESIPPSTDVESIPPSTDVESIPPSTDVESIPPSTDVESVRVSESLPHAAAAALPAVRFATVPDAEAVTLPPLMAAEASRLELIGAEGSITLVSGEPTPRASGAAATNQVDGSVADQHLPPQPEEVVREVNTSAPVAWPVGDSKAPAPGLDGAGRSARRDRSRRIVLAVVAAAVVLVIVAVLRAAFSTASHAAGAPGPTTQPVASDAPPLPATAAAPPSLLSAEPPPSLPSAEPPAQASAAPPTSVPTVASAARPENSVRKPVFTKKRPYRPSGI